MRGKGAHKTMPGSPDDGLETIPLDFAAPQPRSGRPLPWDLRRKPLPYKTMRPGETEEGDL